MTHHDKYCFAILFSACLAAACHAYTVRLNYNLEILRIQRDEIVMREYLDPSVSAVPEPPSE